MSIKTILYWTPREKQENCINGSYVKVNNLQENSDSKNLEELLQCFNISWLKLPPTRITQKTSSSIESACTNMNQNNIQISIILSGLLDHTAQLPSLHLLPATLVSAKQKRRNFKQSISSTLQD